MMKLFPTAKQLRERLVAAALLTPPFFFLFLWGIFLSQSFYRIDLIDRLKKRYQVLLLSNTNAIHVSAFTEMIRKENGIADFKGLFHGAYYSCEMGLRKPDAAAFHHVLEQHDAEAERTLFIDDSMQHVIGARAAGLHAQHLELAHENVRDLVKRLGLFA